VALVVVGGTPLVGMTAAAAPAPPRALLITPTGFDFGEVFLGETSAPQEVVVTNVSTAPVDVSGLTVGPITVTPPTADQGQFAAGTTTCTGSLDPAATCAVPFTFTPAGEIGPPIDGATTITVGGQTAEVHLTGTGLEPFLVSPTGIDFGVVTSGFAGPGTVIVHNVSTTARDVTVTGALATLPFVLDSDTCVGSLPSGAECRLEYFFDPGTAGTFTETLSLQVNGRPVEVTLAGTAAETAEWAWLDVTAVDFGAQYVGMPGPSTLGGTVTVSGSATYTIASITEPANPEFQRFSPPTVNCTAGLSLSAVGQSPVPSCALLYRYTPADWGPPDTATVTVVLDDGEADWTLTLALKGASKRPFLVTPIGFDFGDVALGATAPDQTSTVTNVTVEAMPERLAVLATTSGGPLVVSAVGVEATPFGGTTDCDDVTLSPGETCTIDYAFTPAAFGPAATTAEGQLEYHVALNGAAASPGRSLVLQQNGTATVQPFVIDLKGVARDDVPPTITVTVTPAAPAATGWYNLATGAPTVSFTCTDPEPASGIASCTGPTTLGTLATPQTVNGTAVDVAGNTASVTSPALLVDLVAPKLTCPAAPTFVEGAAGTVTASLTDAESGVATATVSVAADTASPGNKTATLSGADVAGNPVTVSCPYVVTPKELPPTGTAPTGLLLAVIGLLLVGGLAVASSRRAARAA
jgi:hypothetical protein